MIERSGFGNIQGFWVGFSCMITSTYRGLIFPIQRRIQRACHILKLHYFSWRIYSRRGERHRGRKESSHLRALSPLGQPSGWIAKTSNETTIQNKKRLDCRGLKIKTLWWRVICKYDRMISLSKDSTRKLGLAMMKNWKELNIPKWMKIGPKLRRNIFLKSIGAESQKIV